jgi:hypothetical protein
LEVLPFVKEKKILIMEDDDWYHPTYVNYMSNLLDKADLVGFGNILFYYPSIKKFMEKKSAKQPALAQTGFTDVLIPVIQNICERAPKEFDLCGKGLVDVFLWKDPLDIMKDRKWIRLTTSLKTINGKILPKGTDIPPPFPESLLKRVDKNNGAVMMTKKLPDKGTKSVVFCERYLTIGMKGMPGRKGLTTHHSEENQKYRSDPSSKLLKSILESDAEEYLRMFP